MFDMGKIGGYIVELRKTKNITQTELADMLSVSHQAVSKWERGESLPDVSTLPRIAEIFDVSVDDIINGGKIIKPENNIKENTDGKEDNSNNIIINEDKIEDDLNIGNSDNEQNYICEEENNQTHQFDYKYLLRLAPYLSHETLNKIIDKILDNEINQDCLKWIAPFLSQETLDEIIDKIPESEINQDCLKRIAPFLSHETLDKIVDKIPENEMNQDCLNGIAPYLSHDELNKIVDKIPINDGCLHAIAPFLDKSTLDNIADNLMTNKRYKLQNKSYSRDTDMSYLQKVSLNMPDIDDNKLRIVVFKGNKLIKKVDYQKEIEFTVDYQGDINDVECWGSLNCEDVHGDANVGTHINCGDIGGNATAGTHIDCGDVTGIVNAGTNISCGDVGGSANAGLNVDCGDVSGNVKAGMYVTKNE